MDLTSSEESRALTQTIQLVLEKGAISDLIRSVSGEPSGSDAQGCWKAIAATGALGALVPESSGGLGLRFTDVVEAFDTFGYYGVPLPYIETICVVAPALAEAENGQLQNVLAGSCIMTATRSPRYPAGYSAMSDYVLVGSEGQHGDDAYLCNSPTCLLSTEVEGIDESRALRYVQVPNEGARINTVARSWEKAAIASASALLGLSRRILDMTVEYTLQRHQFGKPIGSFQAIKHHLANIKAQQVQLTPLIKAAAWEVDHSDSAGGRYLSAAKIMAARVAAKTAKVGLQCHGAIAYTTEYDLQLFAKQIWALSVQWGTTKQHYRELAHHLQIDTPR